MLKTSRSEKKPSERKGSRDRKKQTKIYGSSELTFKQENYKNKDNYFT